MASMSPLRAVVRDGRLVLDEPTDLPDGTVIELVPALDDELDEAELQKLRALLERSEKAEQAGQMLTAAELIDKIRASR